MSRLPFAFRALFALTVSAFSFSTLAQAQPATSCTPMAAVRISGKINDNVRVSLAGNVHPLAQAEFDQGRVSDDLSMEHIIMLLQRTPQQELAMQTRIDQMHNQRSPLFHQWLSAPQVGQCYGVADADIAAVTTWLQQHGFHIDSVPAGKMMILFTGTAGQVREAFQTEIHNLDVRGEKHIANMSAPSVPAALAPVVAGFRSLHNFFPKPTMHVAGILRRDPKTGDRYMEPIGNQPSLKKAVAGKHPGPLVTYSGGFEAIGPQDFYVIYDENPLLTGTACNGAACNGKGETIAVIEETDVCKGQTGTTPDNCNGADDFTAFESQFGLPAATVNYSFGISGYCSDPGVQGPNGTGEESEADLDLQWASTVAPAATVDFLACASTASSAGVDLSAMYAINNLSSTISSFSVSYGICEPELPVFGFGANSFYNTLWEQAVAQGQTVVVSAGDSGDDTCDRGATSATSGWNVNGIASTPFDVVAGGTDFSDNYSSVFAAPPNAYWNTNDTMPYESALSYVPETTWNSNCGSILLATFLGFTPEQVCNGDSPYGFDFTSVNASGGGGISSIYSLPTWQSVYGVGLSTNYSSSSKRNLPDLAMFAGNGLWNHALQFCESDLITGTGGGTPCDYADPNEGGNMLAGGTSFVSPQLNGLMAIINQRWPSGSPSQPTRQGQADYTLYGMAAHEYGTPAAENTSTTAPSVYTCESNANAISAFGSISSSCVFHNINRTPLVGDTSSGDCTAATVATCVMDGNVQPCTTADEDCFTATTGDAYGLLSVSTSSFEPAWYQSAGYSDAVGLGSVDINNLVSNWTSSTWITPFASTIAVTASPTTIPASGTTTLTAKVTATGRGGIAPPLGTVTFYEGSACSGTALGTAALKPASGCTTSCNSTATLSGVTGSALGGGTDTVVGCFSGDGANDAPSNGATTVTVIGFKLTANPATIKIAAPGESGSTTIEVSAGAAGAVSLSCSGLPAGAACSFNPATVTGGGNSTLTITTGGSIFFSDRGSPGSRRVVLFAMLFPGLLLIGSRAAKRRVLLALSALILFAGLVLIGCGGGGGGSSPIPTPPGTYTVTVTGTASNGTESTKVTLTVE